MEKNQIFITCGTEYKEMTKRILEESGLAEQIGNKAFRIGIKPNMVPLLIRLTGQPPTLRFWQALLNIFRKEGSEI